MRILFIGEYSNLHTILARQLRAEGHEVHLMSDRNGYLNTPADIFIERKKGLFGGAKYLYDLFTLLPRLKDYDVVQLINSNFLFLRPGKIKYFFDKIKAQNRSVFLTLAGNDYYFVKACCDARIFKFSEFKIGNDPSPFLKEDPERMYGWISGVNRDWSEYLYKNIDGAMSVLPEYDMASREVLGDRLKFTNLPMEIDSISPAPLNIDGPLRLFIGMRGGYELQKGTKYLLQVAQALEKEYPGRVEVDCVKNLPFNEYLERLSRSHIVLDQFYSYSPGMNALYAMAMGKVAATGAQPEYYEYIGNPAERPLINLSPLEPDVKDTLAAFVEDPTPLLQMGEESRKLVVQHNDVKKVTAAFISHWSDMMK